MRIKLLRLLSKLWCSLPRCWRYNWQGYYMVHYILWRNGKIDVWHYTIPSGLHHEDL